MLRELKFNKQQGDTLIVNPNDHQENQKLAMHISKVTVLANILLASFKMFAGLFAHSSAMVSDAVDSASDVLSTLIVMIGIKISGKQSDEDHPYGHDRFECVASIILSVMLGVTGVGIGISGVNKIAGGLDKLRVPGVLALIAAIVSIVVKESMFWYTKKGADKIHSSALMADAWHHRSDALSSVGSLLGIGASLLGFPIFDPIASIVICLFILKAAIGIFKDSINKMVDRSADQEVVDKLIRNVRAIPGVERIDDIATRQFGSKFYVDLEIAVREDLTVREGHDIAQRVHDTMERNFPEVKHVMIHVNPYSDNSDKHEIKKQEEVSPISNQKAVMG